MGLFYRMIFRTRPPPTPIKFVQDHLLFTKITLFIFITLGLG